MWLAIEGSFQTMLTQIDYWWIVGLCLMVYIIWAVASIMTTAPGVFGSGMLLVATSLFVGGFHICNLGYKVAAIGAWIASGFFAVVGFVVVGFFVKSLFRQKQRERWEEEKLRTGR